MAPVFARRPALRRAAAGALLLARLDRAQDDGCLAQRSALVADCDWAQYALDNPDVAASPEFRDDARRHFLGYGFAEGRACPPRDRAADGAEACFYVDHAAGVVAAVPASLAAWADPDPGRFWVSSRVWRVFAAMWDLEGLTLLDVGAGDGSMAEIARRIYKLGAVKGLEFRDPGASTSMYRAGAAWADVELYDALPLPAASETFDVVSCMFVLHHVPRERQPALLAELARVSRDWVLVNEELDADGFRRYNAEHARDTGAPADGYRDETGWRAAFEVAGLDVVASGPAFGADHNARYFALRKRRPPPAACEPPATVDAERTRFLEGMYDGFERGRAAARLPHVRESPDGPLPAPLGHLMANWG